MEKVEWNDVQGLVRSGFLDLPYATYVLWRFEPAGGAAAKAWLERLADRLMPAEADDDEDVGNASQRPKSVKHLKRLSAQAGCTRLEAIDVVAVNVALTKSGLAALGVEQPELAQFSLEFQQGMAPRPLSESGASRRSSQLGDVGENSPENWQWGGWGTPTIDGLLLLYAASEVSLQQLIEHEKDLMQGAAVPIEVIEGRIYKDHKEHFGFRDGISQPAIEGTRRARGMSAKQARISRIKPGEFVLGYLNERGARMTFSGPPARAAGNPGAPSRSRDLGRNGTYLVFRQLLQNVRCFENFIRDTAKSVYNTAEPSQQQLDGVASWVVGRTRKGSPLISRAADSRDPCQDRNDFLYYFEDRFGLECPIGAHIRRANPRDAMGPDPETALRLSKMHRIIRRGRLFGKRIWAADGEPEGTPGEPRGLSFIALNADIAGQFEMIQHSWLNGTHFCGLHFETDPMSHYRPPGHSMLTVQHRPTNLHIDAPKFVTVRGGAYFFLPGIEALRCLARDQRQVSAGAVQGVPAATR
jgi:deferrochelatase/peroxidase EfeB